MICGGQTALDPTRLTRNHVAKAISRAESKLTQVVRLAY
jgi:hypothetical protein